MMMAIHFGFGRYNYYLSPPDLVKILKCFFPLGLLSFWASSLARIAIGGMLLCFPASKTWRIVLWALVVVQFAVHSLRPILAIKSYPEQKVVRNLILVNVFVVVLDVTVLATQYTNNF
jgi:hypothetical protein